MTVAKILKMDSTVLVQVGASQLQKVLRTLSAFAKANEQLAEQLRDSERTVTQLKEKVKELENVTVRVRSINSIDLSEITNGEPKS